MKLLPLVRSPHLVCVDNDVYEWAKKWKWKLSGYGYVVRSANGASLHRMVLGLAPDDQRQGDHKNRNKLDNRRSNLRIVLYAQNRQNEGSRQTYRGKPPKSKYRGVFHASPSRIEKRPNGKPWFVKHRVNGQEFYGGSYDTEEQANKAAIAWRSENMPFAVN